MQIPTYTLANGVEMPKIGFGTWRTKGQQTVNLVKYAIETGYTSIDTAAAYENEEFVGQGIRESGAKREDLFITTKLRNRYHGYDTTLFAFDESMKKLGLETLDLYLIHWPGEDMYLPTWKAFVRLYEEKRIRAIGVSNFYPQHIDVLYGETGVMPVVDQIETHPYLHQNVVIDYCRKHNILVEAWSPLMVGGEVLKDPVITAIAEKHGKSPAQTILRWHTQNGFAVIPKSSNEGRIKENLNIFDFELTDEEMAAMNELTKKNIRVGDDPLTYRFKLLAQLKEEGLV